MSIPRVVTSRRKGFAGDLADGLHDLWTAMTRPRLWAALAMHDIAARYRGSIIGPFWITGTTAVFVIGVGTVYSQLFHQSMAQYIPWLGVGIVLWTFFATCVTEGCETFVSSAGIIKQTALPMFTFLFRTVARNLIVLAHQMVVVAGVLVFYGIWRRTEPLYALAGLVLVLLNLVWAMVVVSIISTRFRDVPQIIAALLQVLIFVTPVFWRPEALTGKRFILSGNPLYHMLEITRRPLLGEIAPANSWWACVGMAVVGWAFALLLFAVTRRRVVHYL